MPDADRHITALKQLLGEPGVLAGTTDTESYARDWRGLYQGRALAVARPATTAELSALVRYCGEQGIAMVPQGGNTGMCGGATPSATGHQLIISTARMTKLRAIDRTDLTMTIEAGVPLKTAQDIAREAGFWLPLSISAEGTAQIGGVLSTNAGGNNTLRYGNARDFVLGLEVVLPDGQIWNGLRRLRKDNTGYCLRHLFMGAEGTLGIITCAVLKLVPAPRETEVALCAVPSAEAALALYGRFQAEDPASLVAFEYMSGTGMDLVLEHIPGATLPLSERAEHYALVELATPRAHAGLRGLLESVLESALEAEIVLDAAFADSEAQRLNLWKLREEHAEAQKRAGANVKNDVSVPVSASPAFIAEAQAACEALIPGIRVAPFGHMGDGNIHFNLIQPEDSDGAVFLARAHDMMDVVNEVVRKYDGSFSAEHGIGQLKTDMMADWRGGAELDVMQKIKHAIDPRHLMNPGKLLPAADPG
jgi:FAD/FMN-containing dehydrogenase